MDSQGTGTNGSGGASRTPMSDGGQPLPTPGFDNSHGPSLPPLTFEQTPLDHPARTDTLTPIMEVASRQTSVSTMRTGDFTKSLGSQSSNKGRGNTGSGSSKAGPASRLEGYLVAEDLTTSPKPVEARATDQSNPTGQSRPENSRRSSQSSYSEYSHNQSTVAHTPGAGFSPMTPLNAVASQTTETLRPPATEELQQKLPASSTSKAASIPPPPPPERALPTEPPLTKETLSATPIPSSAQQQSNAIVSPKPQRLAQADGDHQELENKAALAYAEPPSSGAAGHEPHRESSTSPQQSERPLSKQSAERPRPRIVTDLGSPPTAAALTVPAQADRKGGIGLGRKPSGARAMPARRQASSSSSVPSISSATSTRAEAVQVAPDRTGNAQELRTQPGDSTHSVHTSASFGGDALAAMTYLNVTESPVKPALVVPLGAPVDASEDTKPAQKSSFALSQNAADRRARAQESERQREVSLSVPGAGKRKGKSAIKKGNWSASSDEDENTSGDGDQRPDQLVSLSRPSSTGRSTGSRNNIPPSLDLSSSTHERKYNLGRGAPPRPLPDPSYPQRRASRNLPPIPGVTGNRAVSMAGPDYTRGRSTAEPSPPASGNRSSSYHAMPSQAQGDLTPNVRPPPRSSMWISDLDAAHTGINPNENVNSKFVTLDQPAQLTKAFTPHGLLQAGLQDKEDRSARRQEEVAKETGSALINVPNKPPPPQTGLLGAITAHERDRKGAGGIGAALTERERDRRIAVSSVTGTSALAGRPDAMHASRRSASGRSTTSSTCSDSK